jgi:hypothetical protein
MSKRLALIVAFVFACTLAVSACGAKLVLHPALDPPPAHPHKTAVSACRTGSAFALSLVSDRGGQRTPVLAATWFSRHGGVPGIPAHGWRLTSHGHRSALVTSGQVTLHVIQGPDKTWQVDSGQTCPVPLSSHGPTPSSQG